MSRKEVKLLSEMHFLEAQEDVPREKQQTIKQGERGEKGKGIWLKVKSLDGRPVTSSQCFPHFKYS
jgi:hypothetical protein